MDLGDLIDVKIPNNNGGVRAEDIFTIYEEMLNLLTVVDNGAIRGDLEVGKPTEQLFYGCSWPQEDIVRILFDCIAFEKRPDRSSYDNGFESIDLGKGSIFKDLRMGLP